MKHCTLKANENQGGVLSVIYYKTHRTDKTIDHKTAKTQQ